MSGDTLQQPQTRPNWELEKEARKNLVGFFDILVRIDKRLQQGEQSEQKEVSFDEQPKDRKN